MGRLQVRCPVPCSPGSCRDESRGLGEAPIAPTRAKPPGSRARHSLASALPHLSTVTGLGLPRFLQEERSWGVTKDLGRDGCTGASAGSPDSAAYLQSSACALPKWGRGVAAGSPSQVLAVPVPALDALGRLTRGQQAACRWLLAWLDLSFQPEESQRWRAPERRAAGRHARWAGDPVQCPWPASSSSCHGMSGSNPELGWAHPSLLATCCQEHPTDRHTHPAPCPAACKPGCCQPKGSPVQAALGRGALQDRDPWLGSAQTWAGGSPGHWGLEAVPIAPGSQHRP